jgi:hypothetical protein
MSTQAPHPPITPPPPVPPSAPTPHPPPPTPHPPTPNPQPPPPTPGLHHRGVQGRLHLLRRRAAARGRRLPAAPAAQHDRHRLAVCARRADQPGVGLRRRHWGHSGLLWHRQAPVEDGGCHMAVGWGGVGWGGVGAGGWGRGTQGRQAPVEDGGARGGGKGDRGGWGYFGIDKPLWKTVGRGVGCGTGGQGGGGAGQGPGFGGGSGGGGLGEGQGSQAAGAQGLGRCGPLNPGRASSPLPPPAPLAPPAPPVCDPAGLPGGDARRHLPGLPAAGPQGAPLKRRRRRRRWRQREWLERAAAATGWRRRREWGPQRRAAWEQRGMCRFCAKLSSSSSPVPALLHALGARHAPTGQPPEGLRI